MLEAESQLDKKPAPPTDEAPTPKYWERLAPRQQEAMLDWGNFGLVPRFAEKYWLRLLDLRDSLTDFHLSFRFPRSRNS